MKPLVLVHGFMGGSEQWQLQIPDLQKIRQVFAVDLPGFGLNTDAEAPNSINGFASFVLDQMSRQDVETFDLMGHSMGGMIVQEMAAMAPERIDSLILYGTAATGNLPGRFESFETSRLRAEADGVTATARRISATWFLHHENAQEYENCARLAEKSSLQAVLASLEAMEQWSRLENLSDILCPTQIIWGEHDRTYKWTQVERLWKQIPSASIAIIPRCSHAVHMENHQLFNQVMTDFLDQND